MKIKHVLAAWAALGITAALLGAQTGLLARSVDAIQSIVGGSANAVARGAGQSAEDFRWTGRLDAGASLEIKGVNGSITVGPASGDEVVVVAEARARRSDPGSVRVERVEHERGITFCAVYPTPEGKRENHCAPGSEGRMSTDRNDVRVDFVVEVPPGVELIGRTVNGDVEALGLGGDVTAVTVNGGIEISTTGFARAETVNGSIRASVGSAELREGAAFSTVNGSITLDLPDEIDADVDASWLNGSFESALPFTLQGRVSRRSARGTLGDGGPRLELETVNGSIRIR